MVVIETTYVKNDWHILKPFILQSILIYEDS